MAVRYNPNPARITEPLYKVEELEKSPLYTVLCGGKELTVYHTDSFDYVIPVVDDDSALKAAAAIQAMGVKTVIITMGKRAENQAPKALGNPYFREER